MSWYCCEPGSIFNNIARILITDRFNTWIMNRIPFENSYLDVHLDRVVAKPEKYFVSLQKNGNTLASFEMVPGYDRWKIIQPAPRWVDDLADDLNELIRAERKRPNNNQP